MEQKKAKRTSKKPHVQGQNLNVQAVEEIMAIPEFDILGKDQSHEKVLSAQQFRRRQLTARHLALLSITMGLSSAVPLPAVLNSFFREASFKRMSAKNTSNFFVYQAPKETELTTTDLTGTAGTNSNDTQGTADASETTKKGSAKRVKAKERSVRPFDLEEQCPPPIHANGFVNPAHISRLSTSSYYAPYFDHFLRSDKAFCTELVYGFFRNAGFFKLILKDYLKNPEKLPKNCLYALCLGIYELLFIDLTKKKIKSKNKAATHATLYEYVEIIKTEYGDSLAGLVNAVLRQVHTDKEKLLKKIADAKELINTPIAANKIPTKKVLRSIHELADLPLIFTEEMSHKFLQIMPAESFHIPVPTYRINIRYTGESNNSENVFSLFSIHDMTCIYLIDIKEEEKNAIEELVSLYTEYDYAQKGGTDPKDSVITVKDWEKKGLLSRQGVASQTLAKKVAEFVHAKFKLTDYDPKLDNTANTDFRFWDACCGRGGKSSALLESGVPIYLCSDPNGERIDYTIESLARLGLVNKETKAKVAGNGCGEKAPFFCVSSAQEIALALSQTQEETDKRTIQLDDYNKHKNIESPQEQRSLGEYSSLYDVPEIEKQEQKNTKLWLKNLQQFSCILVDAPCTTSGTIGRNPEVKHRITQNSLENTIRTQRQILESTWQCLQKDGYLIYATCSCFKRENEGQIADFLKNHNATLIEQEYIIPHEILEEFKGHDVLFYAILQKKDD